MGARAALNAAVDTRRSRLFDETPAERGKLILFAVKEGIDRHLLACPSLALELGCVDVPLRANVSFSVCHGEQLACTRPSSRSQDRRH